MLFANIIMKVPKFIANQFVPKTKKDYVIYIVLLILVIILSFPNLYSTDKVVYKNYTVYSSFRIKNISKLKTIIDNAIKLQERAKVYDENIKQRVFINDSFKLYGFQSAFLNREAFGITYLNLGGIIYINKADIDNNITYSPREKFNKRSLHDIIAHESTHVYLRNKLGFFKEMFMSHWEKEGFCEYVASSSSYPLKKGLYNLQNNITDEKSSASYKYFKARMAMTYMIEIEGKDLIQILDADLELDSILTKEVINEIVNHF